MSKPIPLQYGSYYHIFNRGNNRQNLFIEERNFTYFLDKYWQYIPPVADTYAYCLLWNHYHFLVRIKTEDEQRDWWAANMNQPLETIHLKTPSQQFSNLFNGYAKGINKVYQRTGCVFEHPFHRVEVTADPYFARLVLYIHQNPQRHGFVADFRDWPYTSYHALVSRASSPLHREDVIDLFETEDRFEIAHCLADSAGL
ncbi:MAG: hypothetical protein SH809_15130 [Rhodothermales bacterium]|nr:hypothetical protein [Rhodothermales bacterium]